LRRFENYFLRCVGRTGGAVLCVLLAALTHLDALAGDIPKEFPFTARAERMVVADATRAGKRLVMVGERGHIMLSDDEGGSWHSARTPSEHDLVAVFFYDAKHGWAVGHRGAILLSEDGGENWQRAKADLPENNALMDVWFKNASEGMAVGSFGVIAETADGGKTWKGRQAIAGDFDPHLYAMTRDQAGRMYIAGESGTLLRSMDGGKTWAKLQSPYVGSFFGIICLNSARLLAYGMRGNVFISDDAGEHWNKVDIGTTVTVQGAAALGENLLVLVGNDGMIFASKDNGATFAAQKTSDRRSIAKVLRGNNGGLLLFGEAGFSLATLAASK